MKKKQNIININLDNNLKIKEYLFHWKKQRYLFHSRALTRVLLQYWSPIRMAYIKRQKILYQNLINIFMQYYTLTIKGIFRAKLLKEYYLYIASYNLNPSYPNLTFTTWYNKGNNDVALNSIEIFINYSNLPNYYYLQQLISIIYKYF